MWLSGAWREDQGRCWKSWVWSVPWQFCFQWCVGGEHCCNEICTWGCKVLLRLCLCGEPCIWSKGLPIEAPVAEWVEQCQVQSLCCVGRWSSVVCVAACGWGCVQPLQFVHWWLISEDFLLQNREHRVAICGRVHKGWIWCLYQWLRSHISGCGQQQPLFDVLRWFSGICVSWQLP